MYQPYPGGETQLPEPQRPPAPPSVLTAVKIMYVGATSVLGIVIDVLTVSATKNAIAKRSPHLSASQVNSTAYFQAPS